MNGVIKTIAELASLLGVIVLLTANLAAARAQVDQLRNDQSRLERVIEQHRSEISRLTSEMVALREELIRLRSSFNHIHQEHRTK